MNTESPECKTGHLVETPAYTINQWMSTWMVNGANLDGLFKLLVLAGYSQKTSFPNVLDGLFKLLMLADYSQKTSFTIKQMFNCGQFTLWTMCIMQGHKPYL